jgi:hypothetical protein
VASSTKRRPIHRPHAKPVDPERLAPSIDDQCEPPVVRVNRARQMLDNLPESSFFKLLRNNEFEVVRVGHITFVTTKSVRAFLKRHTVVAAE